MELHGDMVVSDNTILQLSVGPQNNAQEVGCV